MKDGLRITDAPGMNFAIEALDHWGDQEDALAISCEPADVLTHRERENAFRDAARRLREMIAAMPW